MAGISENKRRKELTAVREENGGDEKERGCRNRRK
jgi:hypothetical protein